MQGIVLFYLKNCPFCIKALRYLQELQNDNEKYTALSIKMVEEREEKALADSYNYYYVPTFYLNEVKLHEGAVSKDDVQKVLDAAIEKQA